MALVSGIQYSSEITSRKNFIINGNFDIWQRGTSVAQTADESSNYQADRFKFGYNSTARSTYARSTDVPTYAESGLESNYSVHIDVTTADTSLTAGVYYTLETSLEGYNFAQLKENNATLSFWVKATKTGTYCIAFRNTGNARSYVTEYTVNASDTWEKKIINVAFNESTGTWNTTNGLGVGIIWTVASGTTFHTTADAWQTGNYIATSNQVNGVDSTANNFRLAQIQLEQGTVATDFEKRHFNDEFALCQRYYQKSYDYADAPGSATGAGARNGRMNGTFTACQDLSGEFPVRMRSTPSVTWYASGTGTVDNVRDISGSADHSINSQTNVGESNPGYPILVTAMGDNDRYAAQFVADAEL